MSLEKYCENLRELEQDRTKVRAANIAAANRQEYVSAVLKAKDRTARQAAASEQHFREKVLKPDVWDAYSLVNFDHLRFGYLQKSGRGLSR
ncbi:MAG: hypothetical protein AAFW83_02955 [Pseudomonadota bacterium]